MTITGIHDEFIKSKKYSPKKPPVMPTAPPDHDLDITKHIIDVKGITNMHVHTVGNNNDTIEFVGNKDHTNNTQWPITKEMSKFIANNNNLNKKYLPIVIPYSAACYVCNENKHRFSKKIFSISFIIIFAIIIIIAIIYINKSVRTNKSNNSKLVNIFNRTNKLSNNQPNNQPNNQNQINKIE
jgi:hypothetical protein